MVKEYQCPNCGSDDCDFVDVGLPNALTCIDCGTTFPYELTLFPKVIKTDVIKTEESWPFPTSLRPQKQGLPKYNPNNEEESPL